MVPWIELWSIIVAFSGHNFLFFYFQGNAYSFISCAKKRTKNMMCIEVKQNVLENTLGPVTL